MIIWLQNKWKYISGIMGTQTHAKMRIFIEWNLVGDSIRRLRTKVGTNCVIHLPIDMCSWRLLYCVHWMMNPLTMMIHCLWPTLLMRLVVSCHDPANYAVKSYIIIWNTETNQLRFTFYAPI